MCSASGEIIKFRRKTAVITDRSARRNWRQNSLSRCIHWNLHFRVSLAIGIYRLILLLFLFYINCLLLLYNMNEGGAEQPVQQAPNPNPEIFTGNIMHFERPKFNARQENRLEALKCFKY